MSRYRIVPKFSEYESTTVYKVEGSYPLAFWGTGWSYIEVFETKEKARIFINKILKAKKKFKEERIEEYG